MWQSGYLDSEEYPRLPNRRPIRSCVPVLIDLFISESEGRENAGTVAGTTAAGTGIGTLAGAASGHLGMVMGIGVLGSRGQEVVIPPGTTMELVLDRELRFTASELSGRVQ